PATPEKLVEHFGRFGGVDFLVSARTAPAERLAGMSPGTAKTAVGSGRAKTIELGPFGLVAQDVVSVLDFFELGFRLLVPVIAVRMILAGQLAVRLLDLVFGRVPLDTQSLVVIAGHGWFEIRGSEQ